ncbi:SNF1-related protein kinase regulatory subunit beta-2 [Chlorella vulgaris]
MGQTQGKARARGAGPAGGGQAAGEYEDGPHSFGRGSPPIPGSPLTYSPQVPMEPISKGEEFGRGGSVYGQSEFAGWGAHPKLVPTVIVWAHGGNHVELEGSFDSWTQRYTMQRSGKDFTLVKLVPPGVYQYKFIVDGQWRHDPNLTSMYDDQGNINNVMEVQEYVPENLESLVGFDPPPSPPSSYTSPPPATEDFLKEPPVMPPQLQLSLLNVPPAMDAIAALPRPQHVILNHIYLQRMTTSTHAMVVGTTHRYRSKYVTTVMYKPKKRVQPAGHPQPASSDVSMHGGHGGGSHMPRASQGGTSQTSPMLG